MNDDYDDDDDDVAFFICGTQKGWRFCLCPRSQSIHCFVVCIRMLLLLNTRHRKLHILTKTSIQRKQNSVARSAKPTLSALLRHLHEEAWRGVIIWKKTKGFREFFVSVFMCVCPRLCLFFGQVRPLHHPDQLSERSLREGVNGKKTFSFGHCPNNWGGVYPCPNFLALFLGFLGCIYTVYYKVYIVF